jgi:hypothetical protein
VGFVTKVTIAMTLPFRLVNIHSIHFVCKNFLDLGPNKCIIYGEILHYDWCSSWGFKEADEEMENLVAKLDLDVQQKSLKQSMKDAITYHYVIFDQCFFSCNISLC